MAEHLRVDEVEEVLARVRSGEASVVVRIQALRSLLAGCPACAPALLELGRLLQVAEAPPAPGTPVLDEAEVCLGQAVVASARSPRMLSELAYFRFAVRDDLAGARALFDESVRASLRLFEDASLGMARVLTDSDEGGRAVDVLERALAVLPDSAPLLEALAQARAQHA